MGRWFTELDCWYSVEGKSCRKVKKWERHRNAYPNEEMKSFVRALAYESHSKKAVVHRESRLWEIE